MKSKKRILAGTTILIGVFLMVLSVVINKPWLHVCSNVICLISLFYYLFFVRSQEKNRQKDDSVDSQHFSK